MIDDRRLGCCLSFVPTIDVAATNSWVREMEIDPTDSFGTYLTSISWAMQTITTVGYGDVPTTGGDEKVFSVVGMVIGVAAFSYTVGAVCALVNALTRPALS